MHKCDDFAREHIQRLLDGDDVSPSMYINDIAKIFNTMISHAAERSGISHSTRRILFHLNHNDGLTQLQLVNLTHLTAPSISVALSKMESEGFVRRVADEKDMRQVRVYLTDKGREHNSFIIKQCRETEEIMLNNISEQEKQEICEILRKILKNLVN